MQLLADGPDRADEETVAFLARLLGLQPEIREVGRRLDRIESEMRQALDELGRERFEEYR